MGAGAALLGGVQSIAASHLGLLHRHTYFFSFLSICPGAGVVASSFGDGCGVQSAARSHLGFASCGTPHQMITVAAAHRTESIPGVVAPRPVHGVHFVPASGVCARKSAANAIASLTGSALAAIGAGTTGTGI